MIARHGRRYIADKRGYRSIHTAVAAGDPAATRQFNARVDAYNQATMGDADRAAIALCVAAQFYDSTSVAEYCRFWCVTVSWRDRHLINGRTSRQLRITVERDGDGSDGVRETGIYEPTLKLSEQQNIEALILANGGNRD